MFGILKKREAGSAAPGEAFDWVKKVQSKTEFTPDIASLEEREFQIVFIYNELMRGLPEHEVMTPGSIPICAAFSTPEFVLWKKSLGDKAFAIAMRPVIERNAWPSRSIKGEIYLVQTSHMMELDKYMSNDVYFRREQLPILIPYREVRNNGEQYGRVHTVNAWMYIGAKEWDPKFDKQQLFFPVRTFSNKNKNVEYYCFTKFEFKNS